MPLLLKTNYRLARASIKENRGRSIITCIGIAVGVASIILTFSLTGSVENLVHTQIDDIGNDLIVVRPASSKDIVTNVIEELTATTSYSHSTLVSSDVDLIKSVDGVVAAAPIALSTNTVSAHKNSLPSVDILATTPDFINLEPLTLRYGSFFTDQTASNAVVLGHTLSLELFNTIGNTVGETVTIMGRKFMVLGVLSEVGKSITFDNVDFDRALIMSTTAFSSFAGSPVIQQINVKAATPDILPTVSGRITTSLQSAKVGDENFSVAYGEDITHPATSLFSIISWMLTLVAVISLVIGGIGIMNIMLVSVAERTREIGIRKAVGASARNILTQFLLESLILSFTGGVFGLLLGYLVAFLFSLVVPVPPFFDWDVLFLPFITTVIIGTVFGIYPALKAATKNPIDSLKHYQ